MGGTQAINPDTEVGTTPAEVEQMITDAQADDVIAPAPAQTPDTPGHDENGDGLPAEKAPDPATPGDILKL